MNLPLPTDYSRCLGHPLGHTGKASPKTWCPRIATCARHQTISFDSPDGACTVQRRLCEDRTDTFYIEVEA